MYEDEDTSWSFGIGLFIGALAGAAIASLFTPRSGAQNREVVLERGVVLKERVSGATSSVTTSVKDTTTSAVASVKDATNTAVTKVSDTVSTVKEKASAAAETVTETASSAVSKVSETATSTVEKLQDAASTAAERVSDAASTATEKVSSVAATTSEKVSSAASTATEKVSTVASTAAERISDVASTATEKARELTGRTQDTTTTDFVPDTQTVVSEANYDAEDVRPATTSSLIGTPSTTANEAPGMSTLSGTTTSAEPLRVLSSIDTFEPTMADVTAATPIDPSSLELEDTTTGTSTADVYNAQFGGATTTPAELRSDEQFEVTDMEADQPQQSGAIPPNTVGTNTAVREASEGAERGA